MKSWFRDHKFETHLLSLSLMILASVGMYITLGSSVGVLKWVLIGFFVLANILAITVK